MNIDFSDKTIIVTGATRGIGKSIADKLHQLNANLILTGTKFEEIAELNKKFSGTKKKYYCVDFSSDNSISSFLEQLDLYKKIDVLVNNAGINKLNLITDIIDNDWNDMFKVNLTSPYKLIKSVSKKMIKHNYGRIVNIASIFSVISKTKRSVYTSTKAGLHGLTIGVSNDLAKYNILVNTISPGFILTDLTHKNLTSDEIVELSSQIPANRMGKVEDISNAILFFISDKNTYITGQNIIIDGGFTNV
jgi:3-oxoacyl-[acyl-carrier protein] reductase